MHRRCPEGVGGVATALDKDGRETEAFTRLLRMDGATERSVDLTIRMLRKLQGERGERRGLGDPPPVSSDLPAPSQEPNSPAVTNCECAQS